MAKMKLLFKKCFHICNILKKNSGIQIFSTKKHLYSSMESSVQLSEEGEPQSIGSVASNGLTIPTPNDK